MTGERWQGALTKKKHKKQDNYLLLIRDVYCSYVNFFFADPLQVAKHKANKQYKIHCPQGELKVKSQKQTSPHPHLERKKKMSTDDKSLMLTEKRQCHLSPPAAYSENRRLLPLSSVRTGRLLVIGLSPWDFC